MASWFSVFTPSRTAWRFLLPILALVAIGFLPLSVVAAPLLGPSCTHVVSRGDNLYSIARRYGTTVRDLVVTNNVLNPNYLWVGVRLTIPRCGSAAPSTPAHSPVVVRPAPAATGGVPAGCFICTISAGQTLSWLAMDYHSTVSDIMARNRLTSTIVYPGQRLVVCPRR